MTDKKKKNKMDAENKALVKNTIEMNPKLKEAKGKTVVFGWGRMNPPTTGHSKLAEKMKSVAQKERATPILYLSHSTDPKKNPLSYDDKIMLARKAFGDMVRKSNAKTIIQAMKELNKKFDSVILIVGQDRVQEFDTLLNKYNGKEYNFDFINVVSAGDRDPDADDVTGMSASKMRSLAAQGDMKQFAKGLPKNLKGDAQAVYDMVRAGMKLAEELETLAEAISLQQRRQRAITMRRFKAKIAAARNRMSRRPADQERLKKRAEKKARSIVRAKIAGSGKNFDDLSPAEKAQIEDRVKKRSALVARVAKRLLPKMKRADLARIAGKSVEPIKEAAKKAQEREMDRTDQIEVENDLEALRIIEQVASLYEAMRVSDGYEMVGKGMSKDELFEMRLNEAAALDKILDAVHRNVKAGKDLMDIAWQISRAAGVDMSAQKIRRAYIAKFGEPKTKESNPAIRAKILKKYGMKEAAAGLQGTDRLQKKDTPGEDANESFETMLSVMEEQKSSCDLVGRNQIREFEKVVDKLFEKFGIDFQFTKHFADRMGDERNDPCITLKELADFIKKIYKNQGKSLKDVAGAEAVVRDLQKDLNIPVAVEYDQKNDEFDVVMKTIMRKKNFKTTNKVIDYK